MNAPQQHLQHGSSFGSSTKQQQGPRSKCDQVIFEALCKACEVIVGSRATIVGSGSSRFNLQVPEVPTVRTILSQYRQQLHVPIRLDVFYQTTEDVNNNSNQQNNTKRDLLERWCLQYEIVSTETFLQEESLLTNDPMIQLTHVCRRIVVWLRTLYCNSRLLPAQLIGSELGDAKKIGFSVYVQHDEGNHPTDDLQMPGFILQDMAKAVTTPYGSLSWKVAYCKDIERWIPKRRSVRIVHTPSRPIPMSSAHQKQQHSSRTGNPVAASAPTRRELSYTERSQQRHLMQTGKSFDPSTMIHQRRNPPVRRNTTQIVMNPLHNDTAPSIPENDEPPERVMSGLSLAMMGAEQSNDEPPSQYVETAEATRRAALHEAPPHMREQDYGYAYNNQINWQKLQQPNQQSVDLMRPLAGTPPGAAFLGAATPPTVVRGRSRSDSGGSTNAPLTPPFPPRPTGFVTDRAPLRPFAGPPDSSPKTMENLWMPSHSTATSLVLPSSLLEASSTAMDSDDMPFAVSDLTTVGEGSALLQLAQKCTATRLKLFDDGSQVTTTVEDLTSQLDSMRAFGESLHEDMGDSRTSVRS